MKRAVGLILCGLLVSSPVFGKEELTLAQVLDEFERVEKELYSIEQHFPQTTPAERLRLEKQKTDLQQQQDQLLDQLERLAGPLPPSLRPERLQPVEEQLEEDQIRLDAIQEKDVEKRLP